MGGQSGTGIRNAGGSCARYCRAWAAPRRRLFWREGGLTSPHDVIEDVTPGTEPPDFASPRASDLVFAALIGGVAGAALGARSNRVAVALSTIGGATLLVGAKAVARKRRRGIEIQPLWYRILSTGALVAPLGWLAGRMTSAGPTLIGTPRACSRGFWGYVRRRLSSGRWLAPQLGGGWQRTAACHRRPRW